MANRLYFDNAATSWPKRPRVLAAAWDYVAQCGAAAGRGSYRSSQQADRWLDEGRRQLSQLIGAAAPGSIAFCSSGTHALNAALSGLMRAGDHVIATQIEHNSVLRPLQTLTRVRGIAVDYAACDRRGVVPATAAESLLRPNTRWLVVGHASNVTGAVQPLSDWSRLARRIGARLLVDASQTLGYIPLDVCQLEVDVLAAAGHKGLGGLPGTGLLYVTQQLQAELQPLMTGGTGLASEQIDAVPGWPQSVEVGNLNLPGIVSMAVAAKELLAQTTQPWVAWQKGWRTIMRQLVDGLKEIPGVEIIGYEDEGHQPLAVDRIPLVSILVQGWDVHELAIVLDSQFGIEARSGLHCAALVHASTGSQTSGGTLRLSPGHGTTTDQVQALLEALQQVCGG